MLLAYLSPLLYLWWPRFRKPLGPLELVVPLISLSTLSAPLLSVASSSQSVLYPSDIEPFLKDIVRRFEPDDEIDDILGPVVKALCFHESLFRPEGLAGGDSSWRGIIGGLEALVSIKSIAKMFTRHEDFNPTNAQAHTIEVVSLLGPLLRLGVFQREWVRGYSPPPLPCDAEIRLMHSPPSQQHTLLNRRTDPQLTRNPLRPA